MKRDFVVFLFDMGQSNEGSDAGNDRSVDRIRVELTPYFWSCATSVVEAVQS